MHQRRKSRAHVHHLAVNDGYYGLAPRLNRLPQRLDYTLIPAPLDLTLPLVDEKAELPAIIVTPSSPVLEREFFIAFLAPPPSPSFSQRLAALVPSFRTSQIQLPATPFKTSFDKRGAFNLKGRIRAIILLCVLLFIMASHVAIHRIATNRPHMEFGMTPDHDIALPALSPPLDREAVGARVDAQDADGAADHSTAGWYNLRAWWAPTGSAARSTLNYVVEERKSEKDDDNDAPAVQYETAA